MEVKITPDLKKIIVIKDSKSYIFSAHSVLSLALETSNSGDEALDVMVAAIKKIQTNDIPKTEEKSLYREIARTILEFPYREGSDFFSKLDDKDRNEIVGYMFDEYHKNSTQRREK